MKQELGLQFANYIDEEVGHVIKKPHDIDTIRQLVPLYDKDLVNFPEKINQRASQIYYDTQKCITLVRNSPEIWELLGIELMDDEVIMQTYATPLSDILARESVEEAKQTIRKYIQHTRVLWAAHGLFETTYNFAINYGITSDNRLILLDIGELSDNTTVRKQTLQEGYIFNQSSFTSLPDNEVKKAIREVLQKEFVI